MKKRNIIFLLIPLITACGVNSFSALDRNDTQIRSAPKAFDPKRTEYTCAAWTPPSPPDAEAHLWYRAATLLDAKDWRMNKEEFHTAQGEKFLDENFGGSLPQFLAAFTKRKKLSDREINEIQKLINEYKEE